MRRIILGRLVTFFPTVFLVVTLVFAIRLVIPGGPAQAIAGDQADAQTIAAINHQLGLDRPLVEQFGSWLWNLSHGDLGISYTQRQPVTQILTQRLAPTLELVLGALVVVVVLGTLLGMLAAVKRRTPLGRSIFSASGVGLAVPDFWLATVAVGVFALSLGLVPAGGYEPISAGLLPNLRSVVLPIASLAIVNTALVTRHIRSAMVTTLESSHIRTAWAVGLPGHTIYFNYALRNSIGPLLTFIPVVVASLVGASAVVETVFNIPGLGSQIVSAATSRDYATLQAIVVLLAVMVLVLNLLADLALAIVDPRVRHA